MQLLGYTLESHALLALGRADEALACLHALAGALQPDHPYLMSLAMALQQATRHAEAVPVFLQALALKTGRRRTCTTTWAPPSSNWA